MGHYNVFLLPLHRHSARLMAKAMASSPSESCGTFSTNSLCLWLMWNSKSCGLGRGGTFSFFSAFLGLFLYIFFSHIYNNTQTTQQLGHATSKFTYISMDWLLHNWHHKHQFYSLCVCVCVGVLLIFFMPFINRHFWCCSSVYWELFAWVQCVHLN